MPWSKEDIERHIAYCDAMAKTAQAFGHTIDAQAWVWKRMGAEDALRMYQPVGHLNTGGTFVPPDCSARARPDLPRNQGAEHEHTEDDLIRPGDWDRTQKPVTATLNTRSQVLTVHGFASTTPYVRKDKYAHLVLLRKDDHRVLMELKADRDDLRGSLTLAQAEKLDEQREADRLRQEAESLSDILVARSRQLEIAQTDADRLRDLVNKRHPAENAVPHWRSRALAAEADVSNYQADCRISRDRIDRLEGDLAYSEEVRRCLEQMVGRTTVAKRELREQLNTFKKNRPRERTAQILHRGEGPSAWMISYDTVDPTVAQDARIELSKRAWDVLLEHLDPQTPWTPIEAQLISDAMQLADWLYKVLREQESRIGYGLIPTQVYDILQRHRSKT